MKLHTAISLAAFLAVGSSVPAETGALRGIPEEAKVLEAASTVEGLGGKSKPTLIIPGVGPEMSCLLWVDETVEKTTSFRWEAAYRVKGAGGEASWVRMEAPLDADSDLRWPAEACEAIKLVDGRVPQEHDFPTSYAAIAAADEKHGTLLQIGWINGPAGSAVVGYERRMFILRDPAGNYRPVAVIDGGVQSHEYDVDIANKSIEWTGKADAPISMNILVTTFEYDPEGDGAAVAPRVPFLVCQERRLEGPGLGKSTDVGRPTITGVVELKEDSLDTIAEHYGLWIIGSPGAENAVERQIFVAAVRRLNPKLVGVSPLPSGAAVTVPTKAEREALFAGRTKVEELKVDISSP